MPDTSTWTTSASMALSVNDRWLSDERLASVFDKAEAIARTLDTSADSTPCGSRNTT